MSWFAPLACVVFLAAPPAARPAAPPLPAVLTGYEYTPPPVRRTEAERRALIAVAADAEEDPVMRARALTLLFDAPEPGIRTDAVQVARGFLAEASEPFLVRKGVLALGRLLGPAAGPELLSRFRSAGADPRLREACAEALRDLGAAFDGHRRLLSETERDPVVRAALRAPRPRPNPTPKGRLP